MDFSKNPSYIVSGAALNRKGHFQLSDVIDDTWEKLQDFFKDKSEFKLFVQKQLDQMSEYSLIGKTSLYYFQRHD